MFQQSHKTYLQYTFAVFIFGLDDSTYTWPIPTLPLGIWNVSIQTSFCKYCLNDIFDDVMSENQKLWLFEQGRWLALMMMDLRSLSNASSNHEIILLYLVSWWPH